MTRIGQLPRDFLCWLRVDDYDQAKDKATTRVLGRARRGNAAIGGGGYVDEQALANRRLAGSAAIDRMARAFGRIDNR